MSHDLCFFLPSCDTTWHLLIWSTLLPSFDDSFGRLVAGWVGDDQIATFCVYAPLIHIYVYRLDFTISYLSTELSINIEIFNHASCDLSLGTRGMFS